MLSRQFLALALGLAAAAPAVLAQKGGSFEDGGDTLVSAMMVRIYSRIHGVSLTIT